MNSRERFLTALDLGIPDRVPTWDWFDEAVTIGVAEILGLKGHDTVTTLRKGDETEESIDLYCRIVEALGVDGTSNVYNTNLQAVNEHLGRDKYGRGYILSENGMPAIIEPAVSSMKELRAYDMVSRIEESDFDGLHKVVDRLGSERAHCLNLNGPFQEAWNVMGGMDKTMIGLIKAPELVHGVLREVTRFNKALMDEAANIGVDFFMIDGDLCGNDFPLMSVEFFREFILPYKKQMVDHAHALGRKIIKHSDGMVWCIMDDLIDVGFDGFHPVQPQCMDMKTTKAHLYGRMCVFGNVDCLDLLVFGEPQAVREATKQCIAEGSPGGGHILCSSNSLHPGCKPENVIAMFEAAKEFGSYANIAERPMPAPPPPDTKPSRPRRQTRRRRAKHAA
jgi:uroporphyrinogen decarboxylase